MPTNSPAAQNELIEALSENPFVGPRAFDESTPLHGRGEELQTVVDLILTGGIVLLHSPSGAGKTSLIQSGLTATLDTLGYEVLPILRVGLPPEDTGNLRQNRYLSSTVVSLDAHRPPWATDDVEYSTRRVSLHAYLEELRDLWGKRRATQMLIFDQFEEIVTIDPLDEAEKKQFFTELGVALRSSRCAALFAVREERLGDLEPYLPLLSGTSPNRYRLELLRRDAARDAILRPAELGRVSFTDEALCYLLDELMKTKVRKPGGKTEIQPGIFIEPVQLQVICFRLWERVVRPRRQAGNTDWITISHREIEEVGDVGSLLKDFYTDTLRKTSELTGFPEGDIRNWIERELIAFGGVRNQVLQEPDSTGGMQNRVIEVLEEGRLLRAENRRTLLWYEITHDSLVRPIIESNREWDLRNETPLSAATRLWLESGKDSAFLLGSGAYLRYLWGRLRRPRKKTLTDAEQSFLTASWSRVLPRLITFALAFAAIIVVGYFVWRDAQRTQTALANFREDSRLIFELKNELYSRALDEVLPRPTEWVEPERYARPEGRRVSGEEIQRQRSVAISQLSRLRSSFGEPRGVRIFIKEAVPVRSAATLRSNGFKVDFVNPSYAPPNSITFGDSVPMDQVRFVITQLLADSVFVRRLRRFRAEDRKDWHIEITHEAHVRNWPPLLFPDIVRLKPAPNPP